MDIWHLASDIWGSNSNNAAPSLQHTCWCGPGGPGAPGRESKGGASCRSRVPHRCQGRLASPGPRAARAAQPRAAGEPRAVCSTQGSLCYLQIIDNYIRHERIKGLEKNVE
jgi:hypothetical protein